MIFCNRYYRIEGKKLQRQFIEIIVVLDDYRDIDYKSVYIAHKILKGVPSESELSKAAIIVKLMLFVAS